MNKFVFGIQLAYFRKQAKLTQQQLAEQVDCAMSTISRIETGMEYPKIHLFEKFNQVFECFGITYDELVMDEIFEFKRAKEELLAAINHGRAEEIERKLERFKALMDEDNTEHKQYYVLGYLVYMRKKGMGIEEFLERTIELFEMRRNIPDIKDMAHVKLTMVEYMMIYKISMAHFEAGDIKKASEMMGALIKNNFTNRTEFMKRRCKQISASFARILVSLKEYERAQECVGYVLSKTVNSMDARLLFQSLSIQSELFGLNNNEEGVKTINSFLDSWSSLVGYMRGYKMTSKDL